MEKCLKFNWRTGSYEMENGAPVVVTGEDAVKAWLEQMVQVPRLRYEIYNDKYGSLAETYIGKRLPEHYKLSELYRSIEESCAMNPYIQKVYDFDHDGQVVSFTVVLTDGVETSVSLATAV